ncbi:hypothetical protein GCM10010121_012780 [Streptomyces brasiliensis]|uniref:Uncharacterized protein n=1 Tax=Streptomyces brasiliensis TaxID=1954 RepID=A0A917K7H5_9ACTN|nr:hypothetical protein GCM10010121_012780 [Streptomyces brasiliensis]
MAASRVGVSECPERSSGGCRSVLESLQAPTAVWIGRIPALNCDYDGSRFMRYLSGARSLTATAEWIADAPRTDPLSKTVSVPHPTTVMRLLSRLERRRPRCRGLRVPLV